MKQIQILDVTLRDCAEVNGWDFTKEQIIGIVSALDAASIEFIEVGYFSPLTEDRTSRLPAPAYCPPEFLEGIAAQVSNSRIVVMVRPKQVAVKHMKTLARCGVDLIRLPTLPHEVTSLAPHVNAIKSLGMKCSVNIIFGSQHTESDLIGAASNVNSIGADYFYVADTVSGFNPNQIRSLYSKLPKLLDCQLGFHAHDSRRLALANCFEAINTGTALIDGSLAGMGSGGGNLITELIAAERAAAGGPKSDVRILAEASKAYLSEWISHDPVQHLEYILSGLLNKNPIQIKMLKELASSSGCRYLDLLYAEFSAELPIMPALVSENSLQ